MADLFDFNHGGATHPGARAIVHPAADSDRHAVRYRDKRTGVMCGPAGRPTLQNRMVATEGSAMFASWSRTAGTPDRQHPHAIPAHGRAHFLQRAITAVRRFLQRG